MVDNLCFKHFRKMFLVQFVILCAFSIVVTKEDWVEIQQVKPFEGPTKVSGTTFFTETKTPVEVVFHTEQIENVESNNITTIQPKINNIISLKDESTTRNTDRIITKPAKSSIREVFSISTSTEFTPLMSSVSIGTSSPVTTPLPIKRTTVSRNMKRNKNVNKEQNNNYDEIEVEDVPEDDMTDDHIENKQIPEENSFITYAGFMPFIRAIQSTLLEKAHKTVKSKIQILKNLRDNLLYDIDQRIKKLWSSEESTAREYKSDSHIEFPSNEGALMTIGFLTLAVFLVKLVLQVIAAIKAKKAYYNTTTTTAATLTGRKKRFALDNGLDDETTYRILNLIDTYKANSFDYN